MVWIADGAPLHKHIALRSLSNKYLASPHLGDLFLKLSRIYPTRKINYMYLLGKARGFGWLNVLGGRVFLFPFVDGRRDVTV